MFLIEILMEHRSTHPIDYISALGSFRSFIRISFQFVPVRSIFPVSSAPVMSADQQMMEDVASEVVGFKIFGGLELNEVWDL